MLFRSLGLRKIQGGSLKTPQGRKPGNAAVPVAVRRQDDRVEKQRRIFRLPETIIPHSIIAPGYPAEDTTAPRDTRYEADRVHKEVWSS